MQIVKVILGLMLAVLVVTCTGCTAKAQNELELHMYNYPNVLFPTPNKVVLIKNSADKPEEIELSKNDINILQKVMRTAVDRPLTSRKVKHDIWTANRKFSLELTYDKPPQFELVLEKDKSVQVESKKVLINLKEKTLLLEAKDGVQVLSGLAISDEFITFMQKFTKNQGFPLPPGKHTDVTVEQLPLAKPGDVQVEFLPPAQPQNKQGDVK